MSDSISPKEPVYLDIEKLDRQTQVYMSKISGVEIKNIQNSSPDELVYAFRKGFGLDEHNYLAENAKDKGVLCYDLMICQNPLDDKKLQRFYTFFSLKEVKDIKLKFAQIYEDYLKKDQDKKDQDRSHIDTMLQICYSGDKKKMAEERKDEKAVEKYNRIKDGFYLYFKDSKDDSKCEVYTLNTEPSGNPLKSFRLCNSRKLECESLLKEFIEKQSLDEDDIRQCKRIINNYIDEKTSHTPDDKTSYRDFVDAFLGIENVSNEDQETNKAQKEIEKNVYLISLINELAVPGIKSLYFIPLSFPNGSQIGHFVLSTVGNYTSDKGYIDKLRVLSFTLMFPLSQMNMSSVYMKKANVEAIKSAISAIMSRNMSHNLGSHYLYYTKNQLVALADKHDEIGPEIRGAAKVMGYMQSRMDYLATIVSGDKYPYGSVFFKGQIFDELTVDDFSKRHFKADKNDPNRQYKRTTNYLLQNLILSENFTREPVVDGHSSPLDSNGENKKNKILRLRVLFQGEEFTGNSDDSIADGEETIKLAISKISIAMPGGIMSIHAFYNVLENLIRNSAKYLKEDLKEELVFTIAIREIGVDLEKSLPERYEFVIFDNKANALLPISRRGKSSSFQNALKGFLGKSERKNEQTLLQKMTDELMGIKILKENSELDKSNKGLKEMFFSTLWMRAYTYEKSKHMSDILAEIECLKGKDKLDEIRNHAFEYVAVDDKGNVENVESSDALNLGIRFELPKFRMMENISADKLTDNLIEKGLNNFTDILCVDKEYKEMASLKTQFTRVCSHMVQDENSEEEAVIMMKKILSDRFDDFEKYRLCIQGEKECGFDDCDKKMYGIYFESHFADKRRMNDYYYIEAISGENYTKTMQSIFSNGICGGAYVDKSSEYFGLKMKEAALTRITLIDERLYNDMLQNEREWQLQLKNIRVLNLKENINSPESWISGFFNYPGMTIDEFFDGNKFRDGSDATHFLSIHLGMIEKIVKDDSSWIKTFHLEKANLDERVNKLMAWIKDSFKTSKGEVFVSIHSGRGNYSPDLDASLRCYPFISISAIESVYSNAKFLLAQLFYNTVYIGKGVTNG